MTEATTKRKLSIVSGALAARGFHAVIVPIDLTPISDRVLGRLALLPLADDVRITLLHVVPANLLPAERRHAERDAHKALADEIRHFRQQFHKTVTIEPLVKVGAAAKEIAACAIKAKAELIVMGRGGGRAMRDHFLGSTAERVVRHAHLPVLVVRLPPRAAYRRPALALELDPSAHEVIRFMRLVLPPPRPRVEVIHAFQAPYGSQTYPSLSDEAEEREQELRHTATHELAKLLSAALAKADIAPEDRPVWKFTVRYGSPRTIVERAVRKADTELLVLGTRGYSGAAYAFLGSVAGDLLRAAKCDVLMIPPARKRRTR